MEVIAELVSTIGPTAPPIGPRQTAESWRVEELSMLSPGYMLSSLTPIPTPSPPLKPAPATGGPAAGSLVRSSTHSGGGLGLRGEARMRAGLETGERRVWG